MAKRSPSVPYLLKKATKMARISSCNNPNQISYAVGLAGMQISTDSKTTNAFGSFLKLMREFLKRTSLTLMTSFLPLKISTLYAHSITLTHY